MFIRGLIIIMDKNFNSEQIEEIKLLYLAEKQRNEDLLADIIELNNDNMILMQMFKKDFDEIAKFSPEFASKYEKFLLRQGELMVTQRAYKELAIQFGLKLGYSLENIRLMANSLEANVLSNSNDKSHHTNIGEANSISSVAHKLLRRLTKRKNKDV